MSEVIIRNGQGEVVKVRKSRAGYRKGVTASRNNVMRRVFGNSPHKKWNKLLGTEFGRVR